MDAKLKIDLTKTAAIGLAVAVLVSLLAWAGVLEKNELFLTDLRYVERPAPVSDTGIYDIVIDDNAIDQMGRWPWTWDRHAVVAELLRLYGGHQVAFVEPYFDDLGPVTIQKDQARQIAMGLNQFAQPGGQADPAAVEGLIPDFNNRFLRAVDRFPNTFIGMGFTIPEGKQAEDERALESLAASNKTIFPQSKRDAIASLDSFSLPWAKPLSLMRAVDIIPVTTGLSARCAGDGFSRIVQDVDGIVRRTPLIAWYDGRVYPSVALSMAARELGCPLSEIKIVPGRYIDIPGSVRTVRIPIDQNGFMIINWVGTYQNSFKPLPYNLITYCYAYQLAKVYLRQFQLGADNPQDVMQKMAEFLASQRLVTSEDASIIARQTVLVWMMDYFIDRGAAYQQYLAQTGQQEGADTPEQQNWWNQLAINKRTAETLKSGQDPDYRAVEISLDIPDTDYYRDGFNQTKFFFKTGRIHEVQPLYFLEPIPIGISGENVWFSPLDLAGKTVFVGLTATGLNAYNPTPYQARFPMFAMVPSVYNTIVTGKFIRPQSPFMQYLYIFLYALAVTWLVLHFRPIMGFLVVLATTAVHAGLAWTLFITGGIIVALVAPLAAVVLCYVAANLYRYVEEARERKKVRGLFGAMVSPDVLKMLEANPGKLGLGGEKYEATMFSSDVSGFTTISEGVTAQELANILNIYLTPMSNIIMTFGGYCDKYEGDAIKADYGVPVPDPDHAWKGCFSALLQQEELSVIQRLLLIKYGVKITARMGVNTGVVVAGNMGSEKRLQYTAMGEAVTIAEELEPINKLYETWIAIGPLTLEKSKTRVDVRHLDTVKMGHAGHATGVYELMAWKRDKFVEYWTGRPIPPLIVEGWRKILPEKILGYLYYWDQKKLPDGPFYRDFRAQFEKLAPLAVDYMKQIDIAAVSILRTDLENLQKDVESHKDLFAGKAFTKAGQAEIEGIAKQRDSATDDALKILYGWKHRLKEEQFNTIVLSGSVPVDRYEFLLAAVDTAQKRVECYIKRTIFPKPDDRVAVDLADHLKQLIRAEGEGAGVGVAEAQAKAAGLLTQIHAEMAQFIERVQNRSQEYHEFIADHCVVPEIKYKVREEFDKARAHYLKQDWDAAEAAMKHILEMDPNDGPAMKYIERIAGLRKHTLPKDWDGVWAEE